MAEALELLVKHRLVLLPSPVQTGFQAPGNYLLLKKNLYIIYELFILLILLKCYYSCLCKRLSSVNVRKTRANFPLNSDKKTNCPLDSEKKTNFPSDSDKKTNCTLDSDKKTDCPLDSDKKTNCPLDSYKNTD